MQDVIALFLDNNIFLHFKSINEIDWRAYTGNSRVELMICFDVLKELSDKQYEPMFSDRADKAARLIEQFDHPGKEVRQGVTLTILTDPSPLQDPNVDHRIADFVRRWKQDSPEREVAVFTNDIQMKHLCKSLGIRTIRPSKDDRLPLPVDENLRKLRETQQKLQKYEARLPSFIVGLAKPEQLAVPERLKPIPETKAKALLDFAFPDNRPNWDNNPTISLSNGSYLKHSHYVEMVHAHASFINAWVAQNGLVFPFQLKVENIGSATATKVKIWLQFPDHVQPCLYFKEEVPHLPLPAKMPVPSKDNLNLTIPPDAIGYDEPTAGRTNRRIRFEYYEIQHTHSQVFRWVYFAIRQPENIKPFHVDYEVFAEELLERDKGQLLIKPIPLDDS